MGKPLWESVAGAELAVIAAAHAEFLNQRTAAGTGTYSMTPPLIRRAQLELGIWQKKNFGMPSGAMLACGIAEEVGEFAEAYELRDGDAAADAFGDVCIYACNYCTRLELDFHVLLDGMRWPGATPIIMAKTNKNNAKAVGRICHASLKTEQKIRGYDDPSKGLIVIGAALRDLLPTLAFQLWWLQPVGVPAIDVFTGVVTKILGRDWLVDPTTGGDVDEDASTLEADPVDG